MTVVAYKDGIIASDTKASWNELHLFDTKKIVKAADGTIGGGAGTLVWVNSFNKWILSGRKHPWTNFDINCSGMFITTDKQAYCIDSGGILPIILINGCCAIGSGREIAIGAMDANASAEEAVRITINRGQGCGGFVHTEHLGPPIKKSKWRNILG